MSASTDPTDPTDTDDVLAQIAEYTAQLKIDIGHHKNHGRMDWVREKEAKIGRLETFKAQYIARAPEQRDGVYPNDWIESGRILTEFERKQKDTLREINLKMQQAVGQTEPPKTEKQLAAEFQADVMAKIATLESARAGDAATIALLQAIVQRVTSLAESAVRTADALEEQVKALVSAKARAKA